MFFLFETDENSIWYFHKINFFVPSIPPQFERPAITNSRVVITLERI